MLSQIPPGLSAPLAIARRLAFTASLASFAFAGTLAQAEPAQQTSTISSHQISYDSYSLKIDGNRIVLYSGEVHPYRLPSPSLWRDVLQKIKAAGFNGISVYFDWGYHSPSPGKYDFTGIRDMDLFLNLANEIGLYVIARPGPYINAEVDSGGFPAWMVTQPGNLRSTDPLYLKWAYEWMGQIDTILARHQLTNGTGSVIAYQIENEIFDPSTPGQQYMQDLQDKARADGINVNDLGPQSAFPIPAGILNPHGSNTIAIAVWGEEGSAGGIGSSGGLGKVTLIQYGNFRGGVPVSIVAAPPIGNAGD